MFGTYNDPKPTNLDLLDAHEKGWKLIFVEVDVTNKKLHFYF